MFSTFYSTIRYKNWGLAVLVRGIRTRGLSVVTAGSLASNSFSNYLKNTTKNENKKVILKFVRQMYQH